MLGSAIGRNLAADPGRRAVGRFATVPPMRRFATWTTGHRKTVIIGWIVALIVIGGISGSVGADFTEEFKLPASDSKEAFDLLETRFPAQSGETSTIVFKADAGVES